MTRYFAALLVGLGLGTAGAHAQDVSHFRITPSIGVMRFDRTTALSSTETGLSTKVWPFAGLSIMYQVRPRISAGLYMEGSRIETSPDYYRYVLLRTSGSYELYAVRQRVVVLAYGLNAAATLPLAPKLGPYLRGGIGWHTLFPDVQRSRSTESITGTEFVLGGGLNYAASEEIAVRLELLDFMWSDFDREALNPVDPGSQNTVFEEVNPPGISWAKPSLVHNLRLALGFTFRPAGGR